MKSGIGEIIGKTITNVVVTENSRLPRQQVFLVFDDDTYFELYGDDINCTDGIDKGNLDTVKRCASNTGGSMLVYPNK